MATRGVEVPTYFARRGKSSPIWAAWSKVQSCGSVSKRQQCMSVAFRSGTNCCQHPEPVERVRAWYEGRDTIKFTAKSHDDARKHKPYATSVKTRVTRHKTYWLMAADKINRRWLSSASLDIS